MDWIAVWGPAIAIFVPFGLWIIRFIIVELKEDHRVLNVTEEQARAEVEEILLAPVIARYLATGDVDRLDEELGKVLSRDILRELPPEPIMLKPPGYERR